MGGQKCCLLTIDTTQQIITWNLTTCSWWKLQIENLLATWLVPSSKRKEDPKLHLCAQKLDVEEQSFIWSAVSNILWRWSSIPQKQLQYKDLYGVDHFSTIWIHQRSGKIARFLFPTCSLIYRMNIRSSGILPNRMTIHLAKFSDSYIFPNQHHNFFWERACITAGQTTSFIENGFFPAAERQFLLVGPGKKTWP